MRLNQFLARNLGISRRQGDTLIGQKRVRVNGAVGQLFTQVLDTDKIELENNHKWQIVSNKNRNLTLLFYKPIFCVTTRFDPEKRKTIYDYLPPVYFELKPAGRLDYMSEGLLILTNDGDYLQRLTHPKFGGKKVYLVGVDSPFEEGNLDKMQQGMKLDRFDLNPVKVWQDTKKLEQLNFLKLNPKTHWYFFELSEGRNQQIRKMCRTFNKQVRRLVRIEQGEYQLTFELHQKKVLVVPSPNSC